MNARTPHPPRPDLGAVRIDAGPDAGRSIALGAEPLVVGRAPGRGRIVDPSLEAHHLAVRAGTREVVQLAGRVPARVDGCPAGRRAAIGVGTVIEVGSSRLVVVGAVHHRVVPCPGPGRVVLGVGASATVGVSVAAGPAAPVTIDLAATGRLLVTGPSADGLVRAIVAQAPGPLSVVRPAELLRRSRGDLVVVAVDPDPDAGWPAAELPWDAAVVSVGASWAATLVTRAADGSSVVHRFHAAGRPPAARSRPHRPVVAEEVARSGPELARDVAGVPQPARRQ